MNLPDFLKRESTGEIRFTGRRIGLYHFVHYYNEGYSAEMLACQFPDISLATLHKAIAFYLENRLEVDGYVEACQKELDEQRKVSAKHLNLAELRERLSMLHHIEETRAT